MQLSNNNENGSSSVELLTVAETANLLRIKRQTLSAWRCLGRYELPFVKLGRMIWYRREDVLAFIAKHRHAA